MKVIKVIDIETKDDQETFDLESVVGEPAPHAYHINYKNHGFAKFRIDDKSLSVFEKKLGLIEDSMSRKQIYNIMYDMLKHTPKLKQTDGKSDLAGARLLNICKTQLVNEKAVDVITDTMRFVIPVVIKNYIPVEEYENSHHSIFELCLSILSSGSIEDNATKHLVLDALITSARKEEDIFHIVKWFKEGAVFNAQD